MSVVYASVYTYMYVFVYASSTQGCIQDGHVVLHRDCRIFCPYGSVYCCSGKSTGLFCISPVLGTETMGLGELLNLSKVCKCAALLQEALLEASQRLKERQDD